MKRACKKASPIKGKVYPNLSSIENMIQRREKALWKIFLSKFWSHTSKWVWRETWTSRHMSHCSTSRETSQRAMRTFFYEKTVIEFWLYSILLSEIVNWLKEIASAERKSNIPRVNWKSFQLDLVLKTKRKENNVQYLPIKTKLNSKYKTFCKKNSQNNSWRVFLVMLYRFQR